MNYFKLSTLRVENKMAAEQKGGAIAPLAPPLDPPLNISAILDELVEQNKFKDVVMLEE